MTTRCRCDMFLKADQHQCRKSGQNDCKTGHRCQERGFYRVQESMHGSIMTLHGWTTHQTEKITTHLCRSCARIVLEDYGDATSWFSDNIRGKKLQAALTEHVEPQL